jgi:hypothetical protein
MGDVDAGILVNPGMRKAGQEHEQRGADRGGEYSHLNLVDVDLWSAAVDPGEARQHGGGRQPEKECSHPAVATELRQRQRPRRHPATTATPTTAAASPTVRRGRTATPASGCGPMAFSTPDSALSG